MRVPRADPVTFAPDEVLHFPLPNPTNDLYGESPLELVPEEARIDLQALRSNKAIFQNGLNPSAVLLMDENSKKEDVQVMTNMLKQSHTGSGNQHKIVAFSKTKEFKPWTMSNHDLEFLKLPDLATTKVTTAYRIPKVLLAHHNAGDYDTTSFLIRDTYQPRLPAHAAADRGHHHRTPHSPLQHQAAP
jgi:HK97 family phage portal protein